MSCVPCFTGSRVPITTLFDYIEAGETVFDFRDSFPGVTRDRVSGALRLGMDERPGPWS
jgi:uncharacterized protein (DUF433 family)